MSYGYRADGEFGCIPDPPPTPADFCARCRHHRNRHNADCGCTAYRDPVGDIVVDYIRGDYCTCVQFVEVAEVKDAA